jgi:hypothetical protein
MEIVMQLRRIIVKEEIEDLEQTGTYAAVNRSTSASSNHDVVEAFKLLQLVLLPGELMRLAAKMMTAKQSGSNVTVGIEFTRGHARKIVYTESELLERE